MIHNLLTYHSNVENVINMAGFIGVFIRSGRVFSLHFMLWFLLDARRD